MLVCAMLATDRSVRWGNHGINETAGILLLLVVTLLVVLLVGVFVLQVDG